MTLKFLFFCVLNLFCAKSHKLFYKPHVKADVSNHWALLVAGSQGWENYRHQANICHAYHILRNHGIPANRIVTMMYDDIARSSDNPTPGKIINAPGGPDVYEGVVIDYKGEDVNPANFLAILKGDAQAMKGKGSGRVIESDSNDHIFVNFVDHGGPGVLCFPDDDLPAANLNETLKEMYSAQKFAQMVIYIEACYAGSMFSDLSSKINVYVTTASNESESAYACYYDELRLTYLGSVFSVNWMYDSTKGEFSRETLEIQYENVKEATNTSHVSQYGDKKITEETLDDFQGEKGHKRIETASVIQHTPTDLVASEDVPLAILYQRLDRARDADEEMEIKRKIKELIDERDVIEQTMQNIVHRVSAKTNRNAEDFNVRHVLKSHDCYRITSQFYNKHCFNSIRNGYAMKSLWKLVNMCEEKIDSEVIAEAILEECLTFH